MRVWVVERNESWEPSWLIGIAATADKGKEMAQAAASRLKVTPLTWSVDSAGDWTGDVPGRSSRYEDYTVTGYEVEE